MSARCWPMLNNADISQFDHVYIVVGYTDLRLGVSGLALKIREELHMDPFENSLFLFCRRKRDRIKALLYEGDRFLLLYKRLVEGKFQWPQTADDVRTLSSDQYHLLMTGYSIDPSIGKRPSVLF